MTTENKSYEAYEPIKNNVFPCKETIKKILFKYFIILLIFAIVLPICNYFITKDKLLEHYLFPIYSNIMNGSLKKGDKFIIPVSANADLSKKIAFECGNLTGTVSCNYSTITADQHYGLVLLIGTVETWYSWHRGDSYTAQIFLKEVKSVDIIKYTKGVSVC